MVDPSVSLCVVGCVGVDHSFSRCCVAPDRQYNADKTEIMQKEVYNGALIDKRRNAAKHITNHAGEILPFAFLSLAKGFFKFIPLVCCERQDDACVMKAER